MAPSPEPRVWVLNCQTREVSWLQKESEVNASSHHCCGLSCHLYGRPVTKSQRQLWTVFHKHVVCSCVQRQVEVPLEAEFSALVHLCRFLKTSIDLLTLQRASAPEAT